MQRRLTTILAADISGYSRLMARDEEGVIDRLRSVRAEVVDPALSETGGRLVKTMGDGLLAEFASPVGAVRASLIVQNEMRMREPALPKEQRLRFRIGVHLGDVINDGDDILGDAVNIAARLETLSPVGGVCVSRIVAETIEGKVDAKLTPLGPKRVKNIPTPVDIWRVEVEGADILIEPDGKSTQPSLAVMPFDNLSADPDQAFLAEGIVEDVTNELSRFRTLTVIARASATAMQGGGRNEAEVGRELGVRYLVRGAVRRGGDRVRVTAQLIEAATSKQLWSGRWDQTIEDIFDLQDEMTRAIIGEVEPELGAHERNLARKKPTKNLTAWELCQRGHAEH